MSEEPRTGNASVRDGGSRAGVMSVPSQLRLALGALLLLLAGILAASFYVPSKLNASADERYVEEVIPLRGHVRDLVLHMVDQEAAVEAYVATRERASLERYESAKAAVNADLAAIRPYLGDNPRLARLVERAVIQIADVQLLFTERIAAARTQVVPRRITGPSSEDVQESFNRFRRTADEMIRETDRLVQEAREDQHETYRTLLVVLGVLGFIGAAIGVALFVVTPRRLGEVYAAEQRARRDAESRADAARALEHVGDGVILTDPEGRVRFWNPAAARLLDGDGDRVAGRRIDELLPQWNDLRTARAREADGASSVVLPVELPRGERWLAVASVEFDEGTVYAMRDVTEEQSLETMRRDFLATASHELRTPMTSIYGAAMTVLARGEDLSSGQRDEFLQMIASEAERLSRIVDAILLASRVDTGQLEITTDRCDARALARSVLDAVEVRAPDNVSLELDAPTDLPPTACDESRLRQVLLNLVDNAIKYSPAGGEIVVSLAPTDDGMMRFTVRDEGLGFPPEERERIFDRFYRLDPELTRGVGGTGLGLYISRELVERMRGRMWAESEPGRGSSFSFELPLAP